MIEAHGLVKRYGSTVAVNDLSFSIRPGLSPWSSYARSSFSSKLSWDPTAVGLGGMGFATLAIAVPGVLFISSEYSSGMIGTM